MSEKQESAGRRLTAAMFDIVAERGWRGVTLEEVGLRAGLDPSETYAICGDRAQLLDLFARQVDAESVADLGPLPDDPEARYDRLLDILMRRFEVMEPHKRAIDDILRDAAREPFTVLQVLPQSQRSFAFLAAAAGYPGDGVRGGVFAQALSAVWIATQRTWLRDDSPDLSVTMAALDRNLRRAVETVSPFVEYSARRPARHADNRETGYDGPIG